MQRRTFRQDTDNRRHFLSPCCCCCKSLFGPISFVYLLRGSTGPLDHNSRTLFGSATNEWKKYVNKQTGVRPASQHERIFPMCLPSGKSTKSMEQISFDQGVNTSLRRNNATRHTCLQLLKSAVAPVTGFGYHLQFLYFFLYTAIIEAGRRNSSDKRCRPRKSSDKRSSSAVRVRNVTSRKISRIGQWSPQEDVG
jgi:hypothetical protein